MQVGRETGGGGRRGGLSRKLDLGFGKWWRRSTKTDWNPGWNLDSGYAWKPD